MTLNKSKRQVRFLNTENNTWKPEKRFPTHTELVFLKNEARHMKAKKGLNMQIKRIYCISGDKMYRTFSNENLSGNYWISRIKKDTCRKIRKKDTSGRSNKSITKRILFSTCYDRLTDTKLPLLLWN